MVSNLPLRTLLLLALLCLEAARLALTIGSIAGFSWAFKAVDLLWRCNIQPSLINAGQKKALQLPEGLNPWSV